MASRDLTANFVERRSVANLRRRDSNGFHGNKKLTVGGSTAADDSHFLMVEEGEGIQMMSSNEQNILPPVWVTNVDAVHRVLDQIHKDMEILKNMHASRVGSVFGKDLKDMETRIESLTRQITNQFRQAERDLQQIGAVTRRAGGEEATVGANVQRSLAKQLQELSVEFRQSQRKYLADVQAQKSGGQPGDHIKFGIDLNGGATSLQEDDTFFTTSQVSMVDDLTEAVQSRDREISKIAQSIEELGAIFKELAVLVIDQGTILDRIDYNMEAVVEHTKTGISQLEKAEKSQKSARPMKCIFCLLSLIAVLLLILVLKHRRRRWFL